MENVYFLKLFDLSENLVYYINAIEANGGVLAKLRDHANKLELSIRQIAFLDDVILENKQCVRQAQIYSTVLSGLMDARGNIINNNMNILLKNLTLINVIFLPLNLLASMGGMSEFTTILEEFHINWRVGYLLFSIAMVVMGCIMWETLKRYIGFSYEHKK
jgi:magnesium transporter